MPFMQGNLQAWLVHDTDTPTERKELPILLLPMQCFAHSNVFLCTS